MPEPDDRVVMTHPTLPDRDPVEASRRQYDLVWKGLGWELTEDPDGSGPEQLHVAGPPATPGADAAADGEALPEPLGEASPEAPADPQPATTPSRRRSAATTASGAGQAPDATKES